VWFLKEKICDLCRRDELVVGLHLAEILELQHLDVARVVQLYHPLLQSEVQRFNPDLVLVGESGSGSRPGFFYDQTEIQQLSTTLNLQSEEQRLNPDLVLVGES
jgi:hypothetical protein